jgi:hypothetical protein
MTSTHFAAVTMVLLAFWAWAMSRDAAAKGLPGPFSSYADIFWRSAARA